MLRAEVGKNTDPASGKAERTALEIKLRSVQETLYDDWDWPFMRVRADKAMAAGSRYYDFPTNINPERIEKVEYLWGTQWRPVEAGVTMEHYSIYDSDSDARQDPVQRWDWIDTGSGEQVEVWPIPLSAGTLRFTGFRNLNALIANSDTCDMDDLLIVLFAAASVEKNTDDAAKLAGRANTRLWSLRGKNVKANSTPTVPGGGAARRVSPLAIRVSYVR